MGNALKDALPEVLYTYRNIEMSSLIGEIQPKTRVRKTLHTHGVIFPGGDQERGGRKTGWFWSSVAVPVDPLESPAGKSQFQVSFDNTQSSNLVWP